ncbi:GNAT family N-acetyltransferase [Cryobacterium sp. TMT2-15-1]|uniref:GNAT family N-acetyltransferase n=1 Tax=Cryobacterium sp. TMT2-15-1 TaxID=1259246 RepID=UPI00106D3EB3|nr:GNAT family N-acetyltransferase [Cryobacterium sp. TMT2-15-1]TFC60442.1 GNAT family N-acetyltransferase [Cryobacterium sp. TMT2-15-1]
MERLTGTQNQGPRRRAALPPDAPGPAHPEIARWRPATVSDADDLWQLTRAVGKADHPYHLTTREGIERDFGLSYFHPEQDSLIGFTADGTLVAMGMVMAPPRRETLARAILVGGVHPDYRGRGIGRELLAWQLDRAEQQLATDDPSIPRWILAYTEETAYRSIRLFRRLGMECARYFQSLERRLDEPVPEIDLPVDIRVIRFTTEFSAAVHEARDSSFRDHWASQPMSDDAWDSFVTSRKFRPDLSYLALATGPDGTPKVVGFTLATVNEDDWLNQGYTGSHVDLVGVIDGWRGKHIARTLLGLHLRAARAEGLARATLVVDSESPTGALNLYLGMGFTPTTRSLAFTIEL